MKPFVLIAFGLISSTALALSNPGFSAAEIQTHQRNIAQIVSVASTCLSETWAEHNRFFKQYGVSKYFGSRRTDYSSLEGRKRVLRSYGYSEILVSVIAPQQESISCIGLTMRCLEKGFRATNTLPTWNKIHSQLAVDNAFDGTDLQTMLHQLGWKILYWNPDPSQNTAWDAEDRALTPLTPGRKWMPVWGGHAENFRSVMKNKIYYNVPVDDASTLVGYKTEVPKEFKKVPLFVGTAHAGYHVFPGLFGKVIEGHSMREMNSISNMEVSPFNPLAPGGGPRWTRTEKYRSGIVAIPPAY